ncbi:hypothetical protein ACOME3_006663 [Neoechinorhynchus agilis]
MSDKKRRRKDTIGTGVYQDEEARRTNFPNASNADLIKLMQTRGPEGKRMLEETFGGLNGLLRSLSTNTTDGLSAGDEDSLDLRRRCFGKNEIPPKKPKSFIQLIIEAVQDVTLITLIISALISFGLSFYHQPAPSGADIVPTGVYLDSDFGDHADEMNVDWIEGVAIIVAVVVVVFVTAFNDWTKEKQFRGLQSKIEQEQRFSVIRSGQVQQVHIRDIVVGDICLIKYGDLLPADGLIVQSNDLKIDESSLTGETDQIKKGHDDPFVLSGTHVMEGSVGCNSQTGQIFSLLGASQDGPDKEEDEEAKEEEESPKAKKKHGGNEYEQVPLEEPKKKKGEDDEEDDDDESTGGSGGSQMKGHGRSVLQLKLTKLAIQIGYAGMTIAVLTVAVLIVRFCVEEFGMRKRGWSNQYFHRLIRYLITGITVLVVAVPEGLPLAVTLSLAYAVKKMMNDNNLVRHLDACETMGNATAICSDKTGTLTTNRMTVVQLYAQGEMYKQVDRGIPKERLTPTFTEILSQAISVNSGYSSKLVTSRSKLDTQVGNKTECALLGLVNKIGFNYDVVRSKWPEESFVHVYTFNSARKSMSTVIKLNDQTVRLFTKGASEMIMQKCSHIYTKSDERATFSEEQYDNLLKTVVEPMANEGLRTICLATKDLSIANEPNWDDEAATVSGLTLLCLCGIEDPVRPEVPAAIDRCKNSGITVRMVTGDNVNTARCIAQKCGIISPHSDFLVLEGKDFNSLIKKPDGTVSQKQFDGVWPRLRVLARSSPQDKYTLVKHIIRSKLNKNREVVAVTGDGTNDGPALKRADVGFAMGIQGTDVAKEACDIILTDDNFTSIVKAVMWGRNVYDSIAKFLQFQLTVNVVAVTCAFVGACIVQESPLRAVQMLWVNLIMDTLASLALATEPPSEELLDRKPYGRNRALISRTMMKNIIGHSLYQLVVMFFLLFAGSKVFDLDDGLPKNGLFRPSAHFTMIFNAFVLMTLFNEINCRKIHGEVNVFRGIFRNPIFYGIWLSTLVLQVILVQFGGIAFACTKLSLQLWMYCIMFGIGSLLWGQFVNMIPAGKTIPEYGTDVPVDIPHFIAAANSMDRSGTVIAATSGLTKGQVLWLRGITRLQTQVQVVKTFQEHVSKSPSSHW